jgi:hypothetical protein
VCAFAAAPMVCFLPQMEVEAFDKPIFLYKFNESILHVLYSTDVWYKVE